MGRAKIKDTYIFQKYLADNYDNLDYQKIYDDLKEPLCLTKWDSDSHKFVYMRGGDMLFIKFKHQLKTIAKAYKKALKIIKKYGLPDPYNCLDEYPRGIELADYKIYACGYEKQATILIDKDNCFYVIDITKAENGYDGDPMLRSDKFCLDYYFFKAFNVEAAAEYEAYLTEINYRSI